MTMNQQRAASDDYLPIYFRARTTERRIAVTVDDCDEMNNLRRIVRLACENGAKLTLFPIGEQFARPGMAELLRRCVFEYGFEIENHTWSHARIFRSPEVEMAGEIWAQGQGLNHLLGVNYRQHFFRPMGGDGHADRRTHNYLSQLGFKGVAMWYYCSTDEEMDETEHCLIPGAIYLFHTVDGDPEKLERFICLARSRGYALVTLNELLGYEPNEMSDYQPRPMPMPRAYEDDYRACCMGDYSWNTYRMQDRLRAQGLLVFDESTGYYGELTTEAIRKFQQLRGLPVTGIADHETQRLLLED